MNSIRGASVARNTPTICAACAVNLADEEAHAAEADVPLEIPADDVPAELPW